MKQKFLITLMFVGLCFTSFGQGVRGILKDETSQKILNGITVTHAASSATTTSDEYGSFELGNLPTGKVELKFENDEYGPAMLTFMISGESTFDAGIVFLKSVRRTTIEDIDIPTVTLSESELDAGGGGSGQNVSSLLSSSRDVFISAAAYSFGSARFRIRGYDSRYSQIFMNGILVNDMERGRPSWSRWGGLNDATRNKQITNGMDVNEFGVDNIGGVTNINTFASQYRKGIRTSYAFSNRSYTNRLMVTSSTGMMDNGWAITASGSRRWGAEGYVDATSYDAWAYFLAIEKKINNSHTLNLTAFGAPRTRGKQGGATQEAYDEAGSNHYNPYWGKQQGEVRNSRMAIEHQPMAILNHVWKISDKTSLNTALGYSFGRYSGTALNWYDAADPRPTYYKKLPYYNRDDANYAGWTNQQLNWDHYYFANTKNLYTVQNVDGVSGNNVTGNRSKYMVEDRRTDHQQLTATTTLKHELNDNIRLSGNAYYSKYKSNHYKTVDDLLGGDYWYDIDQFAERDFADNELIQSDLNNPNRLVKEGDKFGNDYDINITKIGGWAQSEFSYNTVDFYLGVGAKNTSFYRTGNMKKGLFPDNSEGDSDTETFFDYAVAAGLNYKISGRHYITANITSKTEAPLARNSFISPRTRNDLVEGLESEKILSADASYHLRAPNIKARFSAYYTSFTDQMDVRSFYHDGFRSFVNYTMKGINKLHFGTEIGIEAKLTPTITLKGAAAIGQYTWDSRPTVSISQDNNAESFLTDETVYVKNFYESGTPQQAYNMAIGYRSPHYWWFEISANYFDDIYLSFNPERRTEAAVEGYDASGEYGAGMINNISAQEQLSGQFTLDIIGGKSFRFGKYYLS